MRPSSTATPAVAAALVRLAVLRAELANFGLGMAHTHARLNATQIHNAIRREIGMESAPDDPSRRRSYTAAVNALLDAVEPATINFGSLLHESASGTRLMMLVAQMLKYVDATTPVRFLIAECETSFTLLAALYFAKLFGIADRVEISPLFETRKALERGAAGDRRNPGESALPRLRRGDRAACACRPATPTPGATWARPSRAPRSSACA